MTNPGNGGASGSTGPFEYSDDSVIAKVAVEVSSTDIENLAQLTTKVGDLRTGLEAAARAQGDFQEYLKALPEIQQKVTTAQTAYVEVLKQSVELQQRLTLGAGSAGPAGSAGAAGAGQPDPFAGITAGMGGVMSGAPALTSSQAQAQLTQLRQSDPRAAGAWDAAHGVPTDRQALASMYPSLRQQEVQAAAQVQAREQQQTDNAGAAGDMSGNAIDAAQMVLNENGGGIARRVGGGGGGAAGRARSHSPATGDTAPQDAGGGKGRPGGNPLEEFAGGLADGFGALKGGFGIGAGVTGALALNRIIQNSGEDYQQYKNLGMIRGGGAAEGYGYEVQARMMALNPFISTEQSRQIIQAALRDGYTGKEFDTVTEFIASNLKDMNMDINESVVALRKNIETGGQSVEGFRAQMEALKESSKTGVRTYDDMKAAVERNSAGFVDMGMQGGAAGQMAAAGALAFKNNRILADVGDRFNAAIQQSPEYLSRVAVAGNLPGDVLPQEVPYKDPNFTTDAWKPLMEAARRWAGDPNGVELFRTEVSALLPGLNLTVPEAAELMAYLLKQNPGQAGMAENAKASSVINDRGVARGSTPAQRGASDRKKKAVYQPILDLLNPFNKDEQGNTKSLGDELKAIGGIPGAVWGAQADESYFGGRYQSPVMDQVIEKYGYNGVELVDANGRVVELNSDNEDTMRKLGSGDLKWRQKGTSGPGTTLAATAGVLGASDRQGSVSVNGELTIGLSPEAQRLLNVPRTVGLTQNQMAAQAGFGPATMNAPPVGDR